MTAKLIDEARSIADLQALIAEGLRPEYVFFWGHTPKDAGTVDKSCLSNWHPARFVIEGVEYSTSEHFMMAEKARIFGAESTRAEIILAKTPKQAKSLGRGITGYIDEVWTEQRFEVVVAGNLAKFQQNPALADYLLGTAGKLLVEASPEDSVWGIGLRASDPRAQDPGAWQGLNLLGFALMEVRSRLLTTTNTFNP